MADSRVPGVWTRAPDNLAGADCARDALRVRVRDLGGSRRLLYNGTHVI